MYTRYFSSFEKLYNQSYTVLEAAGGTLNSWIGNSIFDVMNRTMQEKLSKIFFQFWKLYNQFYTVLEAAGGERKRSVHCTVEENGLDALSFSWGNCSSTYNVEVHTYVLHRICSKVLFCLSWKTFFFTLWLLRPHRCTGSNQHQLTAQNRSKVCLKIWVSAGHFKGRFFTESSGKIFQFFKMPFMWTQIHSTNLLLWPPIC